MGKGNAFAELFLSRTEQKLATEIHSMLARSALYQSLFGQDMK